MTNINRPIRASYFDTRWDNEPKVFDAEWPDLVHMWREFSQIPRKPEDKERSTPTLCPAVYPDGMPRRKANVTAWSFVGFDVDNDDLGAMLSFEEAKAVIDDLGLSYVLHTTTKSRPERHRYRILLEIDRDITMDEFDAVWSSFNVMFGGIFDHKTHDQSRLFFVPARWEGSWWAFACAKGKPVVIDDLVHQYPAEIARPAPALPEPMIPEKISQLTALRRSVMASRANIDPAVVTDLDLSPFVTDKARAVFSNMQGGRFYKFMILVAGSALWRGYEITARELHEIAMEANRRWCGGKERKNSFTEAKHALAFAVRTASTDAGFTQSTPASTAAILKAYKASLKKTGIL